MPLLSRKRIVLAKTETTYGTDPTPTGTANAILLRNLDITPIDIEYANRDLIRPYLGNNDQLVGAKSVKASFEVEVAGAGSAGTAPAYGPLLRACGLSETISAGVSVTYAPVSTTFESVTIYVNVDGILHKILGARGNVSLELNVKQIPVYKFEMTGLFVAITDSAAPSPTYTGFITPLPVNKDNTSAFSIHGYSGLMQAMSLNVGNSVVYRTLVSQESVIITDRKATGQLTIEMPTITAKDFFGAVTGVTLGSLAITHGTTAGNKVDITATNTVQLTAPTYVDSDGITMLQMGMNFNPTTAGNNEFSIVVK
jgi:hypothetical protein